MSGISPNAKVCSGFNRFDEPCGAVAKRGTSYCRHHQPNNLCPLTSLPKSGRSDSIDLLNLTTRPYNNLRKAGISSVAELEMKTEDNLYGIVGMGAASVSEIKSRLSTFQERAEVALEEYKTEFRGITASTPSAQPTVDRGDDDFDRAMRMIERRQACEVVFIRIKA